MSVRLGQQHLGLGLVALVAATACGGGNAGGRADAARLAPRGGDGGAAADLLGESGWRDAGGGDGENADGRRPGDDAPGTRADGRDGPGGADGRLDSGPSEGGASPWSTACAAYAKAYCEAVQACRASAFRMGLGDLATCERRFGGAYCEAEMTSRGSLATPVKLASCAAEMAAKSCAEWHGQPLGGCSWSGNLANGQPCSYSQQCESAFCGRESTSLCGQCKAKGAAGAPCSPFETSCESGLVCAEVCPGVLAPGGVCDGKIAFRCTEPVPEGGVCQSEMQCAGDNTCVGGVCAKPRLSGEACRTWVECSQKEETSCLADPARTGRTCAPIGFAAPGERCNPAQTPCSASAQCMGADDLSSSARVCSAPAADGEACGADKACMSPAKCMSGKCATALDVAGLCL